jgi:hypothetical protein
MKFLCAFARFGLLAFAVLASAPLARAETYLEDFEDDVLGNMVGNFAASVFMHNIVGPNSSIVDDTFPLPIPPSLHHQFFMGAVTTDDVTFDLPAGKTVDYASVWMTGTGGGAAGVTFNGTLGSASFNTTSQDLYVFFDTTGANLGDIVSVTLNFPAPPDPPGPGLEALYDDLFINVVPEPSGAMLAAGALAGLFTLTRAVAPGATVRRRRRSCPLFARAPAR